MREHFHPSELHQWVSTLYARVCVQLRNPGLIVSLSSGVNYERFKETTAGRGLHRMWRFRAL
jgi:hypothetical protein